MQYNSSKMQDSTIGPDSDGINKPILNNEIDTQASRISGRDDPFSNTFDNHGMTLNVSKSNKEHHGQIFRSLEQSNFSKNFPNTHSKDSRHVQISSTSS
jgi:hypothetical protein